MIATPAWPPRSTPRLFVDDTLAPGDRRIEGPSAHYLLHVLRAAPGDPVRLFDDRTGEWLALVASTAKRELTVTVTDRLCEREPVPDVWLCFAPLKKGPLDFLVEKACELGAARLVPVITRRTIVDNPKLDRLRSTIVEAAEQCGRTALPQIDTPMILAKLLVHLGDSRALFFADETGGLPALPTMRAHPGPAAILVGPEGGFDPAERDAIRAHPRAHGITLGPRILRAETAAAAALAVWMAAAGDW